MARLAIAALLVGLLTTRADASAPTVPVRLDARSGGASTVPSLTVRTLATIPSRVTGFAQSSDYLAWLSTRGPGGDCEVGVFYDISTGTRTRVASSGRGCSTWGNPQDLLLAGDRLYWHDDGAGLNYAYVFLRSAAVHDRRVRQIAAQSVDLVSLAPVHAVADSRGVYFWTPDDEDEVPGPIVRFDGLKRSRVTGPLDGVGALAAGGGRVAVARDASTPDCSDAPAWSPDGRRIAFARTCGSPRGLWVMDADGTGPRRIADRGDHPDWSPDGSSLAFDATGGVFVARTDGSDARLVVAKGSDPAWSPDGNRLAFTRSGSVYVARTDGSDERLVAASAEQPDWSPDGGRLVFSRPYYSPPDAIEVIDLDGSNRRLVATDFLVGAPAWSPDGRSIVFSSCEPGCGGNGSGSLVLVAPDGTHRTTDFIAAKAGTPWAPSWAPDSRRLIYSVASDLVDAGDSHLFTRTAGVSKSDRQLTFEPAPKTVLDVLTRTGSTLMRKSFTGLRIEELAVGRGLLAAVAHRGARWQLELYAPGHLEVRLSGRPGSALTVSGYRILFSVRSAIYVLDARTAHLHLLVRASATPIGLSVVGNRVAWAENGARGARIRAVTLPAG